MNILVLGGGGREHALAWKIRQSTMTEKLYIAPGNAGTLSCGENVSLPIEDHKGIIDFCTKNRIELVVVGPDDYLATGIVDSLTTAGILAFGPTKAAAEIEWSKAYAKEVMEAAGVPTARSKTFTDYESARAYVEDHQLPMVVKASGLALGKGVTIAKTREEAETALTECFVDAKFGASGSEVLIEEYMEGLEFSVHAICAGTEMQLFPSSQDHKRIYDGDAGPNTGGMGVITPVPQVTDEVMQQIEERIVRPTLEELEKRGRPFSGILYPGIMLTAEGPKVIEFNARFGDPEAQAYMCLLESDIVPVFVASAKGSFSGIPLEWKKEAVACVVMASGGYPGGYEKGKPITGIEEAEKEGAVVFHAGTKMEGDSVVTSGGRVLNVTATGTTLKDALTSAYQGVEKIFFEGAQYRTDIGAKAL